MTQQIEGEMKIRLDLATNDEQGYNTGKVRHIQACEYRDDHCGEWLYHLEPFFIEHENGVCACDIWNGAMQLKLSRKVFPILSYATHVGNYMWNSVVVTNEVHAQIFAYLKSLKTKTKDGREYRRFQMTDGLDDWYVKWESVL